MDFDPFFKSPQKDRSTDHFKDIYFQNEKISKFIGGILNSSLFFFWFMCLGNGRNITGRDVELFPVGNVSEDIIQSTSTIFSELMEDYKKNSYIRIRQDTQLQEFRPGLSKGIIDRLDRVLAKHYGFTDEELDFIINYDIKYRMGAEE